MSGDTPPLPAWVVWRQRSFPDANLLLLTGRQPAMVDSGFVGHAEDTAAWPLAQAGRLSLVVNTHWHSDHVGGNGLLQQGGTTVAASAVDAEAVADETRDAAWLSTSTSRWLRTPSTTPSPTARSFGWAPPTGRSSPHRGTPPAI